MAKLNEVFLKALRTADEMSDQCLELLRSKRFDAALDVLDNRGRVVNIIIHLDEQIRITPSEPVNDQGSEENNLVNQLIKSINIKDEEIFELLSHEKLLTQNEIAKTRKNKENFKGYNLNNLK